MSAVRLTGGNQERLRVVTHADVVLGGRTEKRREERGEKRGSRSGAEELDRDVRSEGRPVTIEDVERVQDSSERCVVASVHGEAHLLCPLSRIRHLALEGCSKIAEQATHRELLELGTGVGVEPLVDYRLLEDL